MSLGTPSHSLVEASATHSARLAIGRRACEAEAANGQRLACGAQRAAIGWLYFKRLIALIHVAIERMSSMLMFECGADVRTTTVVKSVVRLRAGRL